ncbi:MAG: glycosyltransferase [Bacteroidota bacterium]
MPLVTVYITNYNYGKYIKQAIESVLNQSLVDYELLIIDDGSTDNSKEIIELYRDVPNIKIIYQQNKGLNITNNIAMRVASGKYLVRLDADDYFVPNALEKMVNILERDSTLGLVFPDYYYVDASGNMIGEERRHNFNKEVSLYDQPAHGACTIIRLESLRKMGGYNESFSCQDGYDLWIKFITYHKVTNINEPLFYYRQHGNNLTSNENRILSTRRKIKETFVKDRFELPATLAIIPVRNTFIKGQNWPLYTYDDKTILEHKVATCLAADHIHQILITSADREILDFAKAKFGDIEYVRVLERPSEFAAPNQTLTKTIEQAVTHVEQQGIIIQAIMSVSLEYPMLSSEVLSDMLNTLVLFKSDAVLSVRPDNRMFFQHNGHTLQPILDQAKFTKLEREALYRGAGGVVLSTLENFLKNKNLLSGKISHVVVDSECSFGIFSAFDFNLFKHFAEKESLSSLFSS